MKVLRHYLRLNAKAVVYDLVMAAIAQSAPEAKQRVRDFLEGKAAKVAKTS